MNARRNFGSMSPEWQDKQTFKNGEPTHISGFHFIMQDGFEFDHAGGCATIPADIIQVHGHVMKSTELGSV